MVTWLVIVWLNLDKLPNRVLCVTTLPGSEIESNTLCLAEQMPCGNDIALTMQVVASVR